MNAPTSAPSPRHARSLVWLGRLLRFTLSVGMLAAGAYVAWYWMSNRPTAERQPRPKVAALVEVEQVEATNHRVIVSEYGTVVPARSIALSSRISGDIVQVAPEFVPGGFFREGDEILRLEPKDYQLIVEQRESDLAKAQADLRMEMGQQAVSRREYELLGEEITKDDEDLVLRKPQLDIAKAAIAVAEAALERARLDLSRTTITAPFNAVVEERGVDVGTQVAPGTHLATLVGADEYWIEVRVPVDDLKWIEFPAAPAERASPARVYYEAAWKDGVHRTGAVRRLLSSLEPEGMHARVLVTVEDPLGRQADNGDAPQLLLGSIVRTEIAGREIANVFEIPRSALRDGRYIWIMTPESTLEIRAVVSVWMNDHFVYISEGLRPGERIVVSDLGAPVAGMALRTSLSPEVEAATEQEEIAAHPPAE